LVTANEVPEPVLVLSIDANQRVWRPIVDWIKARQCTSVKLTREIRTGRLRADKRG
jgi:hypothetical protein